MAKGTYRVLREMKVSLNIRELEREDVDAHALMRHIDRGGGA